jgi:hypothetical protein
MTLDPDDMTDEIISKLPSSWQPQWVDGSPPKEWMLALCTDTVAMWATLILAPGNASLHKHSAATPITPVSTAMIGLGYTGSPGGKADAFFGAISIAIATHISTELDMQEVLGSATHDHTIPNPTPPPATLPAFAPFEDTASTLETSLVTAANGVGVDGSPMPDQGNENSLNILFGAYAEGFLAHVTANATLQASIDTGTGHTHVIL